MASEGSLPQEAERRRELRRMKAGATGLLLVAAVVFVVARSLEPERPGWGWARAAAEAALVGGLADWFAVTALFRRPLGLPVPHTALIPTRKDALGRSLGSFVAENFLAADAVAERLRAARVTHRAATWLVEPGNAAVVSRHTAAALAGATDVLRDDEVSGALEGAVLARLRRIDVAPLAGRVLAVATAEGRHRPLVDAAVAGAIRFLDEQRPTLRGRFGRESPWWVPEPVDDRIFTKIFDGLRGFLVEVARSENHALRAHLDARLGELVERLQHDPDLAARADALLEELLDHPAVRAWTASLWGELKAGLQTQARDPDSELRRRLEAAVTEAGAKLLAEEDLQDKIDRWLEGVARYVVEAEGHQVGDLIAGTVERWDPNEASRRIETQVGRDLQFIRINGTVVGALAGLVIHALGTLVA
jgi:uncharacterized membrane-anchored protein YjiN (DUF445 family)